MLSNINLADIRSFVLITQLGNFTKAAEALNVSRSHVSRQISQLEAQMGVTLLLRTTRTLKLTDAGKVFFQRCEQALNDIDQALIAAVDNVDQIRGLIKVNSVGGYLGEEIIAQIVTEFMKQHPNVAIQLEFSSHRVDLVEEQFDIAFRMGKLEDSGFIARKLIEVKMGTLASPDYLTSKPKIAHPKELMHHQCLTGSVKKWNFMNVKSGQHVEVPLTGHLQCKNGRVLVKGALHGNGIIRVPHLYCLNELEKGELVEVFDDWKVPSVDFSALYHRDRYQPKRLKLFIEFVTHYFEHKLTNKEFTQ